MLGGAVKVLVAGTSGFVGRPLCVDLDRAGHDVVAMTRNPPGYQGAGTPVRLGAARGRNVRPRGLAVRDAPLRTTTLAYAASTVATGNPALVAAGLITSAIFGWQRAATGGCSPRTRRC